MLEQIQALLHLISGIPPWAVYALLALGTALENVFPPIPSDTFVLVGALLAEEGFLTYSTVYVVALAGNVITALGIYAGARRYGRGIFETRWGHRLLRPYQLQRLGGFYARYGTAAVFASRFMPVFRVLVPAFAGITRLGFWRTALPLGAASALWYAVLLGAGGLAARNLPRLIDFTAQANWLLWTLAGLAALAVGSWWWRSRRQSDEERPGEGNRAALHPSEEELP